MVSKFNMRFQKAMFKIPFYLRSNEHVCLVSYYNDFDSKMGYHLRDKNPQTLRDAYKVSLHIEINRKASGKIGRREDVKILKNPRGHQNEKSTAQEDKMDKMMSVIKDLSYKVARNYKGLSHDKPNYQRQERIPKLSDHPYNKNWHNGKHVQNN